MKNVVLAIFFLFSFIEISSAQTVYITKSGSKYHSANCSSLRKSSIPIELKDAIDRDYTPCSKCSPPSKIEAKTGEGLQTLGETKKTQTTSNIEPVVKKKSEVTSSGRCQAITKKGTQCKRRAQAGSNYCWQHSK